jgi:DNA repair exonuclease SbcCD nuclease subunit
MPEFQLQGKKGRDRQWYLAILFCTVMILMGRIVQVRSWIPTQLHRHGRGIGRLPVTPVSGPPSWNIRNHRSSSRLLAKFDMGDSVTVKLDNSLVRGTIQASRGGGWYSVQLDDTTLDASSSIIKCRSTQMGRPVDSSSKVNEPSKNSTSTTTVQMFSAPNPARPIVHPDAGEKPGFPLPAPTIYDLDAALLDRSNITNRRDQEFLKQVQHHSNYEKWVVFTDLHCSPASLDTCLEVLTRVHELAVERDAGVLFLGDFWHHRGTLRVDCLNSVLEHFRDWTVPMIMIPGNHDQVTLDGHSHGLTPFENAYRVGSVSGPLVLSYPTKFRNALFVPHIRDTATMESILQSSVALEASALFVHAEVTGALMNDLIVSMNGIPPASFPLHKRIYSGHFHKPHTVQASNGAVKIEYLGSPYETTLSEAQQAKSLAVLDANWTCIEYVPMNIGRRHFKVSSWEELARLQLPHNNIQTGTPDNSTIRSGDRIVASIQHADMDSQTSETNAKIKELRATGVMVEIREIKRIVEQSLGSSLVGGEAEKLEEMSPESTWRAYIAEEEHQRKNLNSESAKVLLESGFEILQELEASKEVKVEQSKEVTDLALTKVSVEGFGPFREKVTYPLSNRGLVLLKGTNNDVGSDR